uniref:Secreted protein n=1 Tax=Picea sitchensis TaxID=3332 RepID=D5AAQ2_PICSI|nr:unknown [Picea sitchensis]
MPHFRAQVFLNLSMLLPFLGDFLDASSIFLQKRTSSRIGTLPANGFCVAFSDHQHNSNLFLRRVFAVKSICVSWL